jgi:hypothetical protein
MNHADLFHHLLTELCARTQVVTIEPAVGRPFDALLLACNRETLIYEGWSDAVGPSGELALIDVREIDAVRVS